ncbi:MAG: DUF2279 domain-containing protein [Bacteroidia bacterium]
MIKENNFLKKFIIIFLFLTTHYSLFTTYSQEQKLSFWEPSPEYNKQRVHLVSYSLAGTYAVTMTGLYQLWYKDYEFTQFHVFNDQSEWMQMDKIGHFGSAYQLGSWGIDLFDWTGMQHKKAVWYGGSLGFAFLTTIEIFDGFSEAWGWSWTDVAANAGGAALVLSQQLVWDEQRIVVKFSFHQSDYAQYRPDQLGETYPQNLVKDYNGQTYWLSTNIKSFLKKDSKFPGWLNFSVGYGAEGMTGANENIAGNDSEPVPQFTRYRQFYIAPDIDLTRIKTKSKFLNAMFSVFGFLKFPAPTVEFNSVDNVKFHWLYF